MQLIFGWTSYLLSGFFQLGKSHFSCSKASLSFGVGMRKEDNEKPVNQAKDDLSFSPALAGRYSLFQVLDLKRIFQRYEHTRDAQHSG